MKKLLIAIALFIQVSAVIADEIYDVNIDYYDDYDYYTMHISGETNTPLVVFLDTDNDEETGYTNGEIRGADYLLEIYDYDTKNNTIFSYNGAGASNWSWAEEGSLSEYAIFSYDGINIDFNRGQFDLQDQFKYRVIAWDSSWNEVTASYPDNGMKGYGNGNVQHNSNIPYSDNKFRNVLNYSKLQFRNSHTVVAQEEDFEDFSSDNFYLSDENLMTFQMSGDKGERNELRHLNQFSFYSNNTIEGSVMVDAIGEEVEEITWMQLHHKENQHRPFIRLAWIKASRRDHSSNESHSNGLWAIISKSDTKGSGSDYIFLGEYTDSLFYSAIAMNDGNPIIYFNDREIDIFEYMEEGDQIKDNWEDINDFYYKAGLYFNKGSGFIKVQFDSLSVY